MKTKKCPTCGHALPIKEPHIFHKFDGIPSILDIWIIITDKGLYICRDGSKNVDQVMISFIETLGVQLGVKRVTVFSQKTFLSFTNEKRARLILWAMHDKVIPKRPPSTRKVPSKVMGLETDKKKLNALAEYRNTKRNVRDKILDNLIEMKAFHEATVSVAHESRK